MVLIRVGQRVSVTPSWVDDAPGELHSRPSSPGRSRGDGNQCVTGKTPRGEAISRPALGRSQYGWPGEDVLRITG